tara:strand:- start:74 stop:1543 length:1470 start_codon:yes stop_codon:yes gene_type:complete
MKKLILILLFIPLVSFSQSIFGEDYKIYKNQFGETIIEDDTGSLVAKGKKSSLGTDFIWEDNKGIKIRVNKDLFGNTVTKNNLGKLISTGKINEVFRNVWEYESYDDKGQLKYTYKKNFFGEIDKENAEGEIVGRFTFKKDGVVNYRNLEKSNESVYEKAKKYMIYSPRLKNNNLKIKTTNPNNNYLSYYPLPNLSQGYSLSSSLNDLSNTLLTIAQNRELRKNYLLGLENKYLTALNRNTIEISNQIVRDFFLGFKDLIVKSMKGDRNMMTRGILRPATDYEKGLKDNYANYTYINFQLNKISNHIKKVNNSNISSKSKFEFNNLVENTFKRIRLEFGNPGLESITNKSCKGCQSYYFYHPQLLFDGRRVSDVKEISDLIISCISGNLKTHLNINEKLFEIGTKYKNNIVGTRENFLKSLDSKKILRFRKKERKFLLKNGISIYSLGLQSEHKKRSNLNFYEDWMGKLPFEQLLGFSLIESHLINYKK